MALKGGDQNKTNNTAHNTGNRERASAREMAGMAELARPGGLARESTTGNGPISQDTNHVATNDDQGGARFDKEFKG
jgi:hypothetical protein